MTKLSPAAQAVLDAINKELDEAPWDLTFIAGSAAAATLRAAANQVVPDDLELSKRSGEAVRLNRLNICRQIHAIADELEAQ